MIPLAVTTVTVKRPTPAAGGGGFDEGPAGDAPLVTVAGGVRAHLSKPGWLDPTNAAPATSMRLYCDPVDLHPQDVVVDDRTGSTYRVQWAVRRGGFIESTEAQVWLV